MQSLTYQEIDTRALHALKRPSLLYFAWLGLLSLGVAWGLAMWLYQIHTGMGVAGINHPVMWGVYIANYVFWVGVAVSGTIISGSLYLVRSRFRNSVSRATEAMAVVAVGVCALFPLIHLGRFWVFYYILPYPSQRQIWPNFMSPLVWDVWAIFTYLTTTWIFYSIGLIPDLGILRDWAAEGAGASRWRVKFYRLLAGGWHNMSSQWHHYKRSYLYFAALATPLAVSIHTVTSWDFAMGLLPGWHTTIYGPYFVAGAVFSGMAMALTLLIPSRRTLRLKELIPWNRLEPLAKIVLFTSLLVSYAYLTEIFMGWYGGTPYRRQFIVWHAHGWIKYEFFIMITCNVLIPLLLISRRIRHNVAALFAISLFVNVGMWLERVILTTAPTSHDFLPHNWGPYAPDWVSIGITAASFTLFFLGVLSLIRLFPPVPMADLKEDLHKREERSSSDKQESDSSPEESFPPIRRVPRDAGGVLGVFSSSKPLVQALRRIRRSPFNQIEVFSPFQVEAVDKILYGRASPVRWWTLAGALLGLALGFAMTILTALVNDLVVGGKLPVSVIPYWVIAFEVTVLFGVLFNTAAVTYYTRLFRRETPRAYDPRFSRDKLGLFVACEPEERDRVAEMVQSGQPEEIRVVD